MGQPPYADTAIHYLTEHLKGDPGSAAVHRVLLSEIQDTDSTDERRRLAGQLLERWQRLTCPEYVLAFFGPQGLERPL